MTTRNVSPKNRTSRSEETMTYIVTGPIPKKGQTASSGGIRENGKLQAQYKDPVPYTKPTHPAPVNQSDIRMAQLKNDITFDVLDTLWHEFGKPFVQSAFRLVSDKILARINGTYQLPVQLKEPQVIEVVTETVSPAPQSRDNIVPFPAERIG